MAVAALAAFAQALSLWSVTVPPLSPTVTSMSGVASLPGLAVPDASASAPGADGAVLSRVSAAAWV